MILSRSMNMPSAFEEFMAEVARLTPQAKELEPAEYRIYYDEGGHIRWASVRNHPTDLEYDYMIVSEEEHKEHSKYRVNLKTMKMELIPVDTGIKVMLVKSTKGYQVVKNHAGLILEDKDGYQGETEYYGANN